MKKTILFILILSSYNSIQLGAQVLPKYMDAGHQTLHIGGKTSPMVPFGVRHEMTPEEQDIYDSTEPELCIRSYMQQIQKNVPTDHNGRTTAEDPWTTLGMDEINYDLVDKDYTDTVTRMVRMYVNQNPNEYYQYYTNAVSGSNRDTVKVEYRLYDENLEWMVSDLAWEKINNELAPTKRNIGYNEWLTDNGNTVYLYDTSYTTYVDSYLNNGIRVKYILSERLLISIENGKKQFYRSTTRRKDGSLSNILEEKTDHQDLIYRANTNYDAAGNVTAAEKDTIHYDDTGRITYELHQISTNGSDWSDSYEYILEVDNEGRILVETILGGTRERSTFTWNEDKIDLVLVEKKYNNLADPWENYQKYDYTHNNNVTDELVDYWDVQDEQWYPTMKYTYTTDLVHNGKNLWVSSRADYKVPENEFRIISIDSVYYADDMEQPYGIYSYARNADLFLLSKWEEMVMDDQGRIVEMVEYNGTGSANKTILGYKDPYNPDRTTLEESYSALEIVNQRPVTWKLMSKLYNDYHQYKKEGFRLTDNMNWGSVNGGFYWRIILNSDGQTSRIQSSYTSDTNGDDGIDWWVKYDDAYTYNTGKKLIKIENFKRDNENQPFTPTFFSEWTYHSNGLQEAFYSSYHDVSSIRPILKQQWLYNTDPISAFCNLNVQGDTLITEDKVTLEAVFNTGPSLFTWKDDNGIAIGNENIQEIDLKGRYTLEGIKAGCLSQIFFDIYSLCDVRVSGDTILYRNATAQATAALAEVTGAAYTWYNEIGGIVGNSAILSASQPGLYEVEAAGEHCYGTNSHRIAMVTEIDDQELSQKLSLYPNPSNGFIILEPAVEMATKYISVSILDLAGRKVKDFKVGSNGKNFELNLGGISEGTYILRMTSGEEVVSRRIMVEGGRY